jgi:hypothetical protein
VLARQRLIETAQYGESLFPARKLNDAGAIWDWAGAQAADVGDRECPKVPANKPSRLDNHHRVSTGQLSRRIGFLLMLVAD